MKPTAGAQLIEQSTRLATGLGFTCLMAPYGIQWAIIGDVYKRQHLEQGERFGLMKFGSCIELTLPKGAELYVETGMKVKGGVTVLGRLV